MENLKQFAKVADDPKKRRKLVRRKVPEGMVPWSETTMTRLVDATPEPLTSNMRVSTAMILDVVDRPGDPFVAMRRLLTDNHEPRKRQLQHIREAVGIARSLLQAGVLERLAEPEPDGRRYRLTVDLPPDFALNQPLSTFALAAIDVLDPASETYALDVVSVIEATLEDPRQILSAQLKKARGEAVAADEGRGHRVRRADRTARRGHLSRSRSRSCSATPSRCTCRATRGPPTGSCRRSPSCARCGSGRSPSGSSSASTG